MSEPVQAESSEKREETARDDARSPGVARVLYPNRTQVVQRIGSLDSTVAPEHRVRTVWAWVEQADLSGLYAGIRAVEGHSGRPSIAPEILFALWLYATLEGVGSARELARLSEEHDAYRWICGGVRVNCHTLSDFRSAHEKAFDALLSEHVAVLLAEGLASLERVAQDGIRIRAGAGSASFRRGASLERCLEEAKAQVERLKRENAADPGAASRRRQAAQARAARERRERIERALKRLPQIAEIKAKQAKRHKKDKRPDEARVSTTDAEATNMKMADGGVRPAYNGQFAVDTASQIVVGVDAVCEGSDSGQMGPMLDQLQERYGRLPEEYLVDGGFAAHEQIERADERTVVYAPVTKSRSPEVDPHAPKKGDSEPVKRWRQRMGDERSKAIYKERAASVECVNALVRERGLTRLRVRGRAKVRCVLLLHALAHNLLRTFALAPQLLGLGGGASAESAMAA